MHEVERSPLGGVLRTQRLGETKYKRWGGIVLTGAAVEGGVCRTVGTGNHRQTTRTIIRSIDPLRKQRDCRADRPSEPADKALQNGKFGQLRRLCRRKAGQIGKIAPRNQMLAARVLLDNHPRNYFPTVGSFTLTVFSRPSRSTNKSSSSDAAATKSCSS
jgi:hypothetical protein